MLTVKSILWEKCPPDLQICFSGIWCHITFLLFNKCQRILCAAQQDTKPNSQEKFFFFFYRCNNMPFHAIYVQDVNQ